MHEFVFGKSRCLTGERRDNPDLGTVWTWLPISDAKLIVSYLVAGRDIVSCKRFVGDIAYRVRGKVQITSDAWGTYPAAIIQHFPASLVDFGTVDKDFTTVGDPKRPEARYAPGKIRRCVKKAVLGDPDPDFMTTSHCERLKAVRPSHERTLKGHYLPSLGSRDAGRVLQLVSCQRGSEDYPRAGFRTDRVPVHCQRHAPVGDVGWRGIESCAVTVSAEIDPVPAILR
jgi:hypothetical protein